MKQEAEIEQTRSVKELLKESIVEEMIYYLYAKGIVLKNKEHTGVLNAPISIFPSPIPRSFYNKIEFYQVAFNKLIDKMSRDVEFLKNVLNPFCETDNFIKKHLEILDASEANKNKQTLQLGIFRNDFMIDKFKKFLYQIEINTIASSMGFFSDSLRKFNKHFSNKYPEIFKKYLYIDSTDKEDSQSKNRVPIEKPEVIPSIADAMNQAMNIYITNLNNSNNLLNAINSNLTANFFSKKNVYVLFVVQEKERNIFDQRAIETELYDKFEINVLRLTLQEINRIAKLDSNGELTIEEKIIGLVYFRGGYDEKDFPTEDCWDARKTIELSNAIKCPNINTFLCTFKIFQFELSKKEVLSKYISEELIANDISRFFTKIYYINGMNLSERAILYEEISRNPDKFVVKPQKEGGGYNYYGKDILKFLPENFLEGEPDQMLKESIIMERIFPPHFESYIIHENKLKLAECVSEFSIYGIILSNAENVYLINKPSGFLVRTKEVNCNEGGVAAGYSAIDLPYFYEESFEGQNEISFN